MISFFRCVEMLRPLAAVSKKSIGSNPGLAVRSGDPFRRVISVCFGLAARAILRLPFTDVFRVRSQTRLSHAPNPRPLIPMFACRWHRCCRWESSDVGISLLAQLSTRPQPVTFHMGLPAPRHKGKVGLSARQYARSHH